MQLLEIKKRYIPGILIMTISMFSGCTVGSDQAGVTECGNSEITGVTECGNTNIGLLSSSSIRESSSSVVESSSGFVESSSSTEELFMYAGVATYADGTVASNAKVTIRTQDYLSDPQPASAVILAKGAMGSAISATEDTALTTDSNGYFSIASLPPGNYNIEINDNITKAAMQAISIGSSSSQLNGEFVLRKYASVTGAVNVADGEVVHAKLYGVEHYAEIDEHGRYILDGLPPGDYKVHIAYENDLEKSEDIKDSISLEEEEADFIPTDMPYVIFIDTVVPNSINFWTVDSVNFQDSTQALGNGQIGIFPDRSMGEEYVSYVPGYAFPPDSSLITEGHMSLYTNFIAPPSADKQPGSMFFYFPAADDAAAALRRDLRPWMHQNLVFDILTRHNMQVKVGSRESDAINPNDPNDKDVVAYIHEFGATQEWVWETVSIPLSHFTTADFSQIKVAFFIQYEGTGDAFVDNIRFESAVQ